MFVALLLLISSAAAFRFPPSAELLSEHYVPWVSLSVSSLDELTGSAIQPLFNEPELYHQLYLDPCRQRIQLFFNNHEKYHLSSFEYIEIHADQIVLLRVRNKSCSSGVSLVISTNEIPFKSPIPPEVQWMVVTFLAVVFGVWWLIK